MLNFCFSKGLGAPFGSILIGSHQKIERAKMYRKWYGGCLHQSGLMAGIALNRLRKWKTLIKDDNKKALLMRSLLSNLVKVKYPVQTNMIFIEVENASDMAGYLKNKGVLVMVWDCNVIRMVFSSLVNYEKVELAATIINEFHKF